MIFLFIYLNVILKCCEAVPFVSIHHIVITEVNVDALELIEKGFVGINNDQHKTACIIIGRRPWYIFKTLPTDREGLVVLLSTITEINLSEERSWKGYLISLQHGHLNSLSHQNLSSSSGSQGATHKKRNTLMEYIYVGTAGKKVLAIPCKFGDFIIYLVPEKDIDNFILFFKKNERSPVKPLGFTVKHLELQKINNTPVATDLDFIESFANEPNTKENRLIYPKSDDINQMEKNKLKNLTVCSGLFYHHRSCHVKDLGSESDVQIINEEEIDKEKMRDEIMELSYIKSKFDDIISCNILKSDQKIYSFSIIEHSTEDKIYVWEGYPSKVVLFDVYRYKITD